MKELSKMTENIDISAPNAIGELDEMLRSTCNLNEITIDAITAMFENRPEVGRVIVGLWSFDFLKNPIFIDEYLVSYNEQRMNKNEQLEVIDGLLSVIRYCCIDADEDGDAIDFHYSACGKLFRLAGKKAEEYLVGELKKSPTISLIEALGVLVGTEYQGYLLNDTVNFLKKLADSESEDIRLSARKVLIDDVNRVNKYSKFMDAPVSLQ